MHVQLLLLFMVWLTKFAHKSSFSFYLSNYKIMHTFSNILFVHNTLLYKITNQQLLWFVCLRILLINNNLNGHLYCWKFSMSVCQPHRNFVLFNLFNHITIIIIKKRKEVVHSNSILLYIYFYNKKLEKLD